MSDISTALDIVNRASARFGGRKFTSADANTPGGENALQVFRDTLDLCLGVYPWSWSKATWRLQQSATTPANGWRYGYELTGASERIGGPLAVLEGTHRTPTTRFSLEGDRLYSDHTEIWITAQVRPSPLVWSPTFREALIVAVASRLALALTSDRALRTELETDAFGTPSERPRGGLMGIAIRQDAYSQPAPEVLPNGGPLVQVRREYPAVGWGF